MTLSTRKIYLIVTSQDDNRNNILRLFTSIAQSEQKKRIKVVFIDQAKTNLSNDLKKDLILLHKKIEKKLALSKARNIGISLIKDEIREEDIIAFPDDDCWYSNDVLTHISYFFETNRTIDVLCTNVYDPFKNKTYGNRPLGKIIRIKSSNLFRLPISVGIFIKISNNLNEIWFDEGLGAGMWAGSGEETDLIHRLLVSKSKIIYNGNFKVYHEIGIINNPSKERSYGRGFGRVIGLIIKRKSFSVIIELIKVLIYSLIGLVIFPKNSNKYIYRVLGIFEGLKYRTDANS